MTDQKMKAINAWVQRVNETPNPPAMLGRIE